MRTIQYNSQSPQAIILVQMISINAIVILIGLVGADTYVVYQYIQGVCAGQCTVLYIGLYAGPVYCGIGVLFIVIVVSALLMLN